MHLEPTRHDVQDVVHLRPRRIELLLAHALIAAVVEEVRTGRRRAATGLFYAKREVERGVAEEAQRALVRVFCTVLRCDAR